jgi:hypothetical protein
MGSEALGPKARTLNIRNTRLAGVRTTTGSSNSGAVCPWTDLQSRARGLAPGNKGASRDAELRRDQEQGNNDNPPGLRRPRTAIAQAQPTKMLRLARRRNRQGRAPPCSC